MTDAAISTTRDPWTVGDRIRKLREDAGFYDNRNGFASLIGVHRDSLGKYERSAEAPKTAVVNSIVLATGARPEWILRGELPVYKADAGPGDGLPSEHSGKITVWSLASLDERRTRRAA